MDADSLRDDDNLRGIFSRIAKEIKASGNSMDAYYKEKRISKLVFYQVETDY